MSKCHWEKQVERYFDGEMDDPTSVKSHVESCSHCREYLASLEAVRDYVFSAKEGLVPEIGDAQMPAFMRGIEDGLDEESAKSHKSFWAVLSLVAAALVMALATFSMLTGPGPVKATEIESISTELEGATVEWYDMENGVTTVWINVSEEDVW